MDDYQKVYFKHNQGGEDEDVGDLTERLELRKQLGCKSFKWYLDTIYPTIFKPWDSLAAGEIKSEKGKCFDRSKSAVVKLEGCHGQKGNQQWFYTKTGEIRNMDECLESKGYKGYKGYNGNQGISTRSCHGKKGNQWWEYTDKKSIFHKSHSLCLEAREDGIILTHCKAGKPSQNWMIK